MTASVLFTLVSCTYVCFASVVASALVSEKTINYTCQEGLQVLKLENASRAVNCQQSWSADSVAIGSFMSGSAECQSPCIAVTDGEITIRGCVNATLTVICNQEHVTEFRTHYLGNQNNPSPLQDYKKTDRHHYGICASVFLLLLLLIFAGFSIKHCKSRQCTVRNTGPN